MPSKPSALSRRLFLSSSAGLSTAALIAADLKIAAAQHAQGAPPSAAGQRPADGAPPAATGAARPAGMGGPPPGVGGPPGGGPPPGVGAAMAPQVPLAPGEGPRWEFGPFEDLRDWIGELERRGLLLRVKDVDQDQYEATALMYRLVDRFGMYFAPTLYIENIKIDGQWFKGPVITNHFGHWDTECLTFGIEPVKDDPFATYYKALARVDEYLKLGRGAAFPIARFQTVSAREAPCKQVVLTGDAVDLTKFAFMQSNPADAGRYVNTGSVFTNDAELGKNFGTYRCQIKGPRMLGVNPEPGQGAYLAFMKARERGEKRVKVSIVLGQDPITWVVSSSKLNRAKADELEVVSAVRGKPLKVVRSETNDHLVPANSEMVIEGEIVLDEPMKPEGPFGEMYGYLGRKKDENFWMNVTAITHRRNPWIVNQFTGVTRGFPTAPLEQLALSTFRRFVPSVKMIHSPVEATGMTFVSFKKTRPGEALEIGKRVADIVGIAKVVVMVDDDLEVLDRVQMMHAIGSRWQPQPATAILPRSRGMPLDPSLVEAPFTSKAVIDATRQWPEEGGPREYQQLNRTALVTGAPGSLERVDAQWQRLVGKYRPPGA
jgi:4-hydroxy-3-polyprenylbenzoate decarboxylase